jgi:hypothetical protein
VADQDDVRRIALTLPEARESDDTFAFAVPNKGKDKAIAWIWMRREALKQPRVPAVTPEELTELLTEAWRIQAPNALVKAFDA